MKTFVLAVESLARNIFVQINSEKVYLIVTLFPPINEALNWDRN